MLTNDLKKMIDEIIIDDKKEELSNINDYFRDNFNIDLNSEIELNNIPLNELEIIIDHAYNSCSKFVINNEYDNEFNKLINYFKENSCDVIYNNLIKIIMNFKNNDYANYKAFVNYFSKYHFWGSINPDYGDFETLKLRAEVLKHHIYDFIWFYNRLNDYLSKRTLIAILANWSYLDMNYLYRIKSIFRDYWEPDLFLNNKDDVLVDVGAFTGDSISAYVATYGTNYKKIYAYEITSNSIKELKNNIKKMNLNNVVVKQKGLGNENTFMYMDSNDLDSSANKLNNKGKEKVEIVKLDDDVEDIPTFIKMDIEGAEYNAILGSKNIISKYSPKLAICIYHGYDDIWRIPSLIDNINPNYEFYLRHNGGNLIPTEFVLLCRPKK